MWILIIGYLAVSFVTAFVLERRADDFIGQFMMAIIFGLFWPVVVPMVLMILALKTLSEWHRGL